MRMAETSRHTRSFFPCYSTTPVTCQLNAVTPAPAPAPAAVSEIARSPGPNAANGTSASTNRYGPATCTASPDALNNGLPAASVMRMPYATFSAGSGTSVCNRIAAAPCGIRSAGLGPPRATSATSMTMGNARACIAAPGAAAPGPVAAAGAADPRAASGCGESPRHCGIKATATAQAASSPAACAMRCAVRRGALPRATRDRLVGVPVDSCRRRA